MTQESSNTTPRRWNPKPRAESWCAPEHSRVRATMNKDYPRDDRGERIPGKGRELQVDKRPALLVPPRPTYTIIAEKP
jgi:hypothetical protein